MLLLYSGASLAISSRRGQERAFSCSPRLCLDIYTLYGYIAQSKSDEYVRMYT